MSDHFWAKVDRSAGPGGCWPWTRSCTDKGYGNYYPPGIRRPRVASRVALELHLGRPIADGMQALHRCDNRPCCNPAHLFEGTQLDNIADMDAKGRRGRNPRIGEQQGRAKLRDADIPAIRASRRSSAALAREYGVSRTAIRHVRDGVTWRHVADPSSRAR